MRGVSRERAFKSGNDFLDLLADQPGQTMGLQTMVAEAQVFTAPIYRHKKVGSTMVADYQAKWKAAVISTAKKASITNYAKIARKAEGVYRGIGEALGMPWEIVAVTHMKEASFRMNAHFHNGDPLTARTVQVPKGRIPGVKPPYTFTQSARDAITMHAESLSIDLGRYKWDEVNALFWLETYNGFGYRNRGINSPYLYSYTNLYSKGLFYADRKFSSTKVSKSPGCVPVLKALGWVPFA